MKTTRPLLSVAGILLAGCAVPPDLNIGAPATILLCGGIDPPTELTELPRDLKYVIDNREVFEVTDHPLDDVTVGTVIDSIGESLNGCWGYIGAEKVSALYETEIAVAAVYKIDLDRGLVQMQEFCGLDGSLGAWDDLPAVFVRDRRITAISDNELVLDALYSDAALLEEDGTLRGDCLTAVAATMSVALPVLVTVDGDTMATFEDFNRPLRRRWTRFECVEEEIELLPGSEPGDT